MLKYIAIRYPTLYETIVAIIVTEATPPGQAPLSPMTKAEFFYQTLKLTIQLKGDTRSPEQKPKSEQKPKPNPEQKPKSKSEQKPKPEPEQKPQPEQKPKIT